MPVVKIFFGALVIIIGCFGIGIFFGGYVYPSDLFSWNNDIEMTAKVENTVADSDSTDEGSPVDTWTPSTKGPWDGSLYAVTSDDGLRFSGKSLVVSRAGVPSLLQATNGDLIVIYQYFSDVSKDLFNVIAYSVSHDDGATWTNPTLLSLESSIAGSRGKDAAELVPMDPTLVQLEDGRLRVYFTFHAEGERYASLYSATAPDGEITSTFVVNPAPALTLTGSDARGLLDPAVVYFDGLWHHYSWQEQNDENIHSTSVDGEVFTREENISLPMDFLGQVIVTEGGLRFYGTKKGVTTAVSVDGYSWTLEQSGIVAGADPGVLQLDDGSYLMVYTSQNFNL